MTEPDRIWINDKWEAYLRPTFDGDTSGYVRAAIAAHPARGVGADAVLDAAHAYMMEQYGSSPLKHPADRARILAALEPALTTEAAHVNETPKSEHVAGNVLTDADLIARLREIQGQAGLFASAAADRIEALVKERDEALEWLSASQGYIADAVFALDKQEKAEARAEAAEAEVEKLRGAADWQEKQRRDAFARRHIHAPEDPHVAVLCERYGYGAVMDAASRLWVRKDSVGAFYIGGCIGIKPDAALTETATTEERG